MEKLLTITIPSYNVERYLPEIMPHYFDERFLDDIEILIVNDGSKDHTAEMAEKYQQEYPQSVRLINKENGGHGSTINTGIQHASGKYFKVIDGDDWVDSNAFASFISHLRATDADAVITSYNRVIDSTRETIKMPLDPSFESGNKYEIDTILKKVGDSYTIHSTTFRTELLKKIPKISEKCFYVDMEYILYALCQIETVVFFDDAVYQYRIDNCNQSVAIGNYQKNCKQHKHVMLTLLDHYCEHRQEMSAEKAHFFLSRLAIEIGMTTKIYLSFGPNQQKKEELMAFLKHVETRCPAIFTVEQGKAKWLIKACRMGLYAPVSTLTSRMIKARGRM